MYRETTGVFPETLYKYCGGVAWALASVPRHTPQPLAYCTPKSAPAPSWNTADNADAKAHVPCTHMISTLIAAVMKEGGLLHIRPNVLKVQSRGLVGQLGHRK